MKEKHGQKRGSHKYFIGYDDNGEIIPLIIDYNIYDNGNKKMNFICDDKNLLEKYKRIWEKISNIKSKRLTKEPTYNSSNNAYIRLKIKEYGDWLTNFCNEKSSK